MKKLYTFYFILFTLLIINGCRKTDDLQSGINASSLDLSSTVSRPNIILILADDFGYELPTYTGGESYQTPNLDYIASQGIQFTEAHTAPLCSPSRTMLMTGKYNFRNYTTWGSLDTSNRMIANLLKSKGYATCMAGKWQFDGGDASIRAFGFDKYLVTNPFNIGVGGEDSLSFYKNPEIYENGAYWPKSKTNGKYGEDIIRDYMFDFIDSVTGQQTRKPFFIYWATNLVHEPFSPTPDDPEFATWNPNKKKSPGDSVFFPSMVKYEDKLVGQLIAKLQQSGISHKTLILWLGDNGTTSDIHSIWNGQVVGGDKAATTEEGTHVPMLAYMPGKIQSNTTDTSLISLVDFINTIGDAAGKKIPVSYGTMDGISFYKQLWGDYSVVRPWIFCHFVGSAKNENDPMALRRWMQDHTYKQYDSLPNTKASKKFINYALDPTESNPIPKRDRTPQEKQISEQYLNIMKQLH